MGNTSSPAHQNKMTGGRHENQRAWDPEEDHIILQMVNTEGPKWKSIVANLPGRTVASVRNRFQRIEKGRKMREKGPTQKMNRCHLCNQPKRGHICYAKLRGGPQVDVSPKMSTNCVPLANATVTVPDTFKLWPEAPVSVGTGDRSVPSRFDTPTTVVTAHTMGDDLFDTSAQADLYSAVSAAPPVVVRSGSSTLKDLMGVPELLSRPSMQNILEPTLSRPPIENFVEAAAPPVPQKLGSFGFFMRDFMDTSTALTSAPTA